MRQGHFGSARTQWVVAVFFGGMLAAAGFVGGRMSSWRTSQMLESRLKSIQEEVAEVKRLNVRQEEQIRMLWRRNEIEDGMKADELEQLERWLSLEK